ncbi:OLC1v1004528C1 [Oldenlandia corymbosa var. corymbosa]|uniref:Fatty acyl-CoA reductase n=1 Tax=Oldenlandia corymbosa var. corymbosa TaxID=529605 RepID=A0AAV1DCI9_OLDCO|nr:OLC1v1004528C1 [Oldenlandia corymbosa var. corymbosa]
MEMADVVRQLENSSIIVAGAAGFLAKIFVEKLLRVQPNMKRLYLLLRAEDKKLAAQRFNSEIISKNLFRVLKEECGPNFNTLIAQKVTVVPGDITCVNLGVEDLDLLEEMWKEVDVVVNVAATTNFDERYDVSLSINTMGAMRVLNFAKRSYVSGERKGLILENPYRVGDTLNGTSGLDIENEKRIIDEKLKEFKAENATEKDVKLAMKNLGIQRARKFGWPNTYVFTKAMGEMLLGNLKANFPIVIVRPTIVTSTYKEPFPGWVEGLRTINSFVVGYAQGKLSFLLGDPNTITDLIPGDMVVNAMVAAIVTHMNKSNEEEEIIIYQVGSSASNPISYSSIQDFGQRYFMKHPWIDGEGKAVKVGKIPVLKTMEIFHGYMALRYLLPLKGLEILNAAFCQYFGGLYHNLCRKINYAMRMIELYEPYLFFKGIYDDMNTERLRQPIREEKGAENMLYFDPKSINWEDYFMNIHLPGVVKYVFG